MHIAPRASHYLPVPQKTLIPQLPVPRWTTVQAHHKIGSRGKKLEDYLRTFVVDQLNLPTELTDRTL
jgi:hypothetical protein